MLTPSGPADEVCKTKTKLQQWALANGKASFMMVQVQVFLFQRRQIAGCTGNCVHVYLGPSRTTFATLSVPSVSVADFAKRSSPAALDVAVTVSHDSVPAQGSAAIAPAMASSTGISNCGRRRLARRETCTVLRGVCPQPGSQSRCVCDMQINQKPPRLQTARSVAAAKAGRGRGNRRRRGCQPV